MSVWRETEHPRDRRGRFTDDTGTNGAPSRTERTLRTAGNVTVRSSTGPMTDREFNERADRVDRVIGEARRTIATEVTHAPGGVWSPERDRLHREIADDLYARASEGVPRNREAVIAGGLGGAGKTTVLRGHAGVDPGNYVTLNPDDVKEELARRGLIPDVPGHEDLSPMERAALVHEESSRITRLVADRAYRDGTNVMWDITMSSEDSVRSRVADLRRNGYTNINGVFVDIPTDVSVDRAMARYRRGVDQWRSGEGLGGRYVPPAIIRAQQTSGGRTINRGVFDSMRGDFSRWSMYDNSRTGQPPRRMAASEG